MKENVGSVAGLLGYAEGTQALQAPRRPTTPSHLCVESRSSPALSLRLVL